jgi:hypothetical protein
MLHNKQREKTKMNEITYTPRNNRTQYAVRLNGKTVGQIKLAASGDGRAG